MFANRSGLFKCETVSRHGSCSSNVPRTLRHSILIVLVGVDSREVEMSDSLVSSPVSPANYIACALIAIPATALGDARFVDTGEVVFLQPPNLNAASLAAPALVKKGAAFIGV